MELKRICIVPKMRSVGGPASFQGKFSAGLVKRGIEVTYNLDDTPYDAVLVNGGTRHLRSLRRAARRGIPIVQRLNGMNWMHRRRRTGVRHFLKSEYGNLLLTTIRKRIATGIVYQSEFSRGWWEREHGRLDVPTTVVHNGVDLVRYTPEGPHQRPEDHYRILLVEGNFSAGYEAGIRTAVEMAEYIRQKYGYKLELMIAGKAPESFREVWDERTTVKIKWQGLVPGEDIPALDRSAHVLFSSDINAACPNSVIEALACGLPVAAFDTGALPELVTGGAGRIAPYGGDPWQLDPPDVPALAEAAVDVLGGQETFRQAARARAESAFGLDTMVENYLKFMSA